MLERDGSVVGINDMARLVVNRRDPPREFLAVGNGGGEEDEADLVGEEDDAFLGEGGREGGREGGGGYDVVVHCGGCMIDRQKIRARMEECEEAGVAMTNYGLLLAYAAGPEAFLRAVKPFGVLVPPKLLAHAAALEIKRKRERDGEGGKEGGREEEAPSCVNSACALCPGGEVGRKGVLCKCMIDEQKNE